MRPDCLEFLARSDLGFLLTYESLGPYGRIWEFKCGEAEGSITLNEDRDKVVLDTIDIEPQGTGLGVRIVEAVRDYSELSGKRLIVPGVMNLDFFARFSWLEWTEPKDGRSLWHAEYQPGSKV